MELEESRCSRCGRPRAVHKSDRPEDYLVGHYTCTATVQMDRWSTWWRMVSTALPGPARKAAQADKTARGQGFDPDAAREWFTYTRAERPNL